MSLMKMFFMTPHGVTQAQPVHVSQRVAGHVPEHQSANVDAVPALRPSTDRDSVDTSTQEPTELECAEIHERLL